MLLAAALAVLAAPTARAAEGIHVISAELTMVDEVYQLTADLTIALPPALEDAVRRGVPLHFVSEFVVQRERDWWFNEDIAQVTRNASISYNALLRQFQVAVGNQYRQTDTLPEALDAISHIEKWPVLDRRILKKRYTYPVRLRLRLDVGQLPKPLQVNVLTLRQWELDSHWHEWNLKP